LLSFFNFSNNYFLLITIFYYKNNVLVNKPFNSFLIDKLKTKTESLQILNPKQNPQKGDQWKISFKTKGVSDLIITPQDEKTQKETEFVHLLCGKEKREPQTKQNNVIYYSNWSCENEISTVSHLIKKTGNHHLVFEFKNEKQLAYNEAKSWDSGGDGTTWSDDLNWNPDGEPGPADEVTIDASVVVNIGASTQIKSLVLGNVGETTTPTLNFDYDSQSLGALLMMVTLLYIQAPISLIKQEPLL